MGLKELLTGADIHQGVREFRDKPVALLVDVRTPEEYAQGHIPGSVNIPLQSILQIEAVAEDRDTPIYVYCHSGARSRRAAAFLGKLGYSNVKNIGGILSWQAELEH